MKIIFFLFYFFSLALFSACGTYENKNNSPSKTSSNYLSICDKSFDIVNERNLSSAKLLKNSKKLDPKIKEIYKSNFINKDRDFAEGIALNIFAKVNAFHIVSLPSFRDRLYSDCRYNIHISDRKSFIKNLNFFNSNINDLKNSIEIEYSKINTTHFKNDDNYRNFKIHVYNEIIITLIDLKEITY